MNNDWQDWWEIVRDLAFRETGRAMLWLLIGGGAGLLISIGAILMAWVAVKKRKLFQEDVWGIWGRRVLLLVWVVSIPLVLVSNGALWGLFVAAEKTVVSQNLIEKGFQGALTKPWELAFEQAFTGKDEEGIPEVLLEDGEFSVSEATALLDQAEEEMISYLMAQLSQSVGFGDSSLEASTPGWIRKLIGKFFLSIEHEGMSMADLLEGARGVLAMAQAMDGEGDDHVNMGEVAWSVGALHGVPFAKKQAKILRVSVVVGALTQVLFTLVVVLLICWGGTVLLRKSFGQKSEAEQVAG